MQSSLSTNGTLYSIIQVKLANGDSCIKWNLLTVYLNLQRKQSKRIMMLTRLEKIKLMTRKKWLT